MNVEIVFKDFPKICRLCLGYGDLKPILHLDVLNVYHSITNLKVKEEDKLPENVCKNCIKKLEDISIFIDLCKSNDEVLRNVMIEDCKHSLLSSQHKTPSDAINNKSFGEDDVKSENNDADGYFSDDIKDELYTEPDSASDALPKEENSISCQNCSQNFSTRANLIEHYREIVNCRPRSYNNEREKTVPNIVEYLTRNIKSSRKTKIRQKINESDDDEPEIVKGKRLKGKRRFLCSYCGKNYTRKNGLDRHILSHTGVKPFECKECGKRYITKDTLKTHLRTHTGVKAYKCTVCQKSFIQSSHLSYHMRRHSGDKPFSCAFCGKGFLSNYHLERHKLMHTGVKPFKCDQCEKQFVRATTLRDHLLIHTGEKPFQCQHCGKQFNRKQSLTNHVLVHTGQVKSRSSSLGNLGYS